MEKKSLISILVLLGAAFVVGRALYREGKKVGYLECGVDTSTKILHIITEDKKDTATKILHKKSEDKKETNTKKV